MVFGAMWGVKPELADVGDEVVGVVALVAGDRASPFLAWEPFEHLERGVTFRVAGRFGELDVDEQRVAMLHQQMPRVAELRGGRVALAVQPRLGIGRRLRASRSSGARRGNRPRRCGPSVALRPRLVFGLEALVRRPRLQQRAVDGEVLARRRSGGASPGRPPRRRTGPRSHGPRAGRRFFVNVVASNACRVDRKVQEPLEQQVVVQPFAERPLGPDRVQRHQHGRLQQRLGRHARPARRRVHRVELAIELGQDRVHDLADPADRMIRRDQILRTQRTQHRQLPVRGSTHAPRACRTPPTNREHPPGLFQHPASGHPGRRSPLRLPVDGMPRTRLPAPATPSRPGRRSCR